MHIMWDLETQAPDAVKEEAICEWLPGGMTVAHGVRKRHSPMFMSPHYLKLKHDAYCLLG